MTTPTGATKRSSQTPISASARQARPRAVDPCLARSPVRHPGDVLRDRAPRRVASRAEADILYRQLAHQRVGVGVAAAARDAAVRNRAVGVDPDRDGNA